MTLGNMRQNGVRSLAITCGAVHCHHCAVMDVSGFPDDVVVPSFGPRMVCTVCGAIGASALSLSTAGHISTTWFCCCSARQCPRTGLILEEGGVVLNQY